ncbi:MAG: glutaminase domain-containing protein [Candidatus Merdivicinus sp.]|jgi:hypothetical protein
MKLRPPALPLITVDPYFSIWSPADHLTDKMPCHWTSKPNSIVGTACIDGQIFRFLGEGDAPAMKQTMVDVEAFSTLVRMEAAGVRLNLFFLTPLIPDDYEHLTRPVSYLKICAESLDGKQHQVAVTIRASEELCLNQKGEMPVVSETLSIADGIPAAKMGSKDQPILAKSGDDIRINWGYFYLAVKGDSANVCAESDEMTWLTASADVSLHQALFTFSYDDIESIVYFGDHLKSWWNRNGKTIETAICEAYADFDEMVDKCAAFSQRLYCDAVKAGGEKYAEMLLLACRQVLAAHKLVLDSNGDILYISKECFSNGCAATVDVSYPSIPFFLLYNPELVRGMMRPIFRYAASPVWPFDFAPHDVGQYPLLNGQVYSNGTDPEHQMPVEECGNMLVMMAAACAADHDASFAAAHLDTLCDWAKYLLENGTDPANQLCTDDFAGHLAHNCNLSLKAIMGLAGLSRIFTMLGKEKEAADYDRAAREMAATWIKTAANGDGSFRLAFDRPDTFSMKYNVVWDKVMGFDIFPAEVIASEFASYAKRINPYGMPLDNRESYTKSDWLVWTATLAQDKEDFEAFIEPLWKTYHYSTSRVPMTDWYNTITACHIHFQHRTVIGGLYIKLLDASGKCR